MEKAKRFYYACVYPMDSDSTKRAGVELGWLGPDPRKDRWKMRGRVLMQPPAVLHSIRLFSFTTGDYEGIPDVIVTNRPIGKCYTEAVAKKVSRPSFDPDTGRRNGRYYRKKFSKVKFRLLEPDEIDADVKRRAIDLPWTDALFDDGGQQVDLPKDVAIMDKTDRHSMGDEAGDDTAPADAMVKKRGRPAKVGA